MDEVIKLRAKSEKEVEQMAKNILHLKENETFEIMVLKKPKKFLFLKNLNRKRSCLLSI